MSYITLFTSGLLLSVLGYSRLCRRNFLRRRASPLSKEEILQCLLTQRLSLSESAAPISLAVGHEGSSAKFREQPITPPSISNDGGYIQPWHTFLTALAQRVSAPYCFGITLQETSTNLYRGGRKHAELERALLQLVNSGNLRATMRQQRLYWRDRVLATRSHEFLLGLALVGIDTVVVCPVGDPTGLAEEEGGGALLLCYEPQLIPSSSDLQWLSHYSDLISFKLHHPRPNSEEEEMRDVRANPLSCPELLHPELLSAVTHDMRAPLATIQSSLRLLLGNPELTKETKSLIDGSLYSCLRLGDHIDDILDSDQLRTKRLKTRPERLRLIEVISPLVESFRPLATVKGLSLHLEVSHEDLTVRCDARHLARIVGNLLHNALKFTTAGNVRVKVARELNVARIVVADTGPGLSEQETASLFLPYNPNAQGSGLGLAVAKMLAEANGITLSAEPVTGSGSRFSLGIPLAHEESLGNPPEGRRPTILIVDDDVHNAESLSRLAQLHGWQAITAWTTQEARVLLECHLIDALIVDFHLDVPHGVYKVIEATLSLQGEIGIALLSGAPSAHFPPEFAHIAAIVGAPLLKPTPWEKIQARLVSSAPRGYS